MSRLFYVVLLLFFFNAFTSKSQQVFVSPSGNDKYDGRTKDAPKKSIESALEQLQKQIKTSENTSRISLLPGTYYLEKTIKLGPELGPVTFEAYEPGTVTVKGSQVLTGKWKVYQGGVTKLKTKVDISPYAQLYVHGKQQHLARYPNIDSAASHFNGYAADAISPKRVSQWEHPEGAIVHAMHKGEWGDFYYEVESVDQDGNPVLKGGHQNNRPSPMHEKYRMVENVFEELDESGEWYFDSKKSTLYFYPFDNMDLNNSTVEVTMLDQLFFIKGTDDNPAKQINFKGIKMEQTNRTFMKEYEPLLRSDWMIHSAGAIRFENAENCSITDCELTNLGGNAIFFSGYNRNMTVRGNHIYGIGASAICFVGLPSAVRSPSFNYKEFVPLQDIDTEKGPKTHEYPSECLVDDNLIHNTGQTEIQTAGVEISMAMDITVRHNSIYDVPRAGINVSEGTWGGHVIEFNDVFNTVLQSSDHGAFNSWGRDRFWHPNRKTMDQITTDNPEMPYWDAIHTTVIRNNRMRCDHGWDIDLDDGSSNYHLYNNLCLNGGIKLREGFYRTVENNIMVNNGFHPHVWFKNSGDVFRRNIVMTGHQDIRLQGWGKEVDYNLFPNKEALEKAQQNGTDEHSLFGDAKFVDPVYADFRVQGNSPALKLGFRNFSMQQFGVQKPSLKKIAKTPDIPPLMMYAMDFSGNKSIKWLGADIKDIETMGERSAAGLSDVSGVLVLKVSDGSLAKKGGLQAGDVIIQSAGSVVKNVADLMIAYQGNNWKGKLNIRVVRNQKEEDIILILK